MTRPAADQAITIVNTPGGVAPYLEIPSESSLQTLYHHGACPRLLRRSLSGPLSWQQRVELTIAQVLLSSHLAPGLVVALLVADTRAVYGNDGAGEELLATLFQGSGLQGRRLQSLQVPVDSRLRWGEAHVARMPADRPLVNAIATVELRDGLVRRARLGLTGVWREQARLAESAALLTGYPLNDSQIDAVPEPKICLPPTLSSYRVPNLAAPSAPNRWPRSPLTVWRQPWPVPCTTLPVSGSGRYPTHRNESGVPCSWTAGRKQFKR